MASRYKQPPHAATQASVAPATNDKVHHGELRQTRLFATGSAWLFCGVEAFALRKGAAGPGYP
jgi:hypothetical protein